MIKKIPVGHTTFINNQSGISENFLVVKKDFGRRENSENSGKWNPGLKTKDV